jgi:hypothetical protein
MDKACDRRSQNLLRAKDFSHPPGAAPRVGLDRQSNAKKISQQSHFESTEFVGTTVGTGRYQRKPLMGGGL